MTYEPSTVFFDPWINRDYYYSVLPLLPLMFDRIFIYYPSDGWIDTAGRLEPNRRELYRQELIHWIRSGVLVPVVKGAYPVDVDPGAERFAGDRPSSDFLSFLRDYRESQEERWVVLDRGATERGRESARDLVESSGSAADLGRIIKVAIDPSSIPELAYHYAGGETASNVDTLIETIGTYDNDDWMRKEYDLGEYLLPSTIAVQYRALQDLRSGQVAGEIRSRAVALEAELTSNTVFALALDIFAERRLPGQWLDRKLIEEWREMGLHNVLRDFLVSEAACLHVALQDPKELARNLGEGLVELRSMLPGKIASRLIDGEIISQVAFAFMGAVIGAVVGPSSPLYAGVGGAVGTMVDAVVGHVGSRPIRYVATSVRWDRFLEWIAQVFDYDSSRSLQKAVLSFGDVTVFGSGGR